MIKNITNKDYYTIGETSEILQLDQHVIRFWTTQFEEYIKPIRKAGLRRYYSKNDIEMLKEIKNQLHTRGLSIRGLQLLLEENKNLQSLKQESPLQKINHKSNLNNILSQLNHIKHKIENKLSN